MLIRKNTKAFKTILEIITACRQRADREKLVRLFITKAGHTIHDRINIEAIQGNSELLYQMNYESVLANLTSSNHQLQVSDEIPGIYFFHSTSNKAWDETPFEFDKAVGKEFKNLPELPITKKKEKIEKYTIPVTKKINEIPKPKEKAKPVKPVKVAEKKINQPDFKLKRKIHFTDLDRVVMRQPELTKKDILTYYNTISEYILPYLKDRSYSAHLYTSSLQTTMTNAEEIINQNRDNTPDWLQSVASKDKGQKRIPMCNDREHLLWNIEAGCLQFNTSNAKVRSSDSPDYIVIGIDSPEHELTKAIYVARVAHEILTGLQLPSFIKTDGRSGFHIYIGLNSQSNFQKSIDIAEYIAKLIRLKIPDMVSLEGTGDLTYGKVVLDYTLNQKETRVIVPYSLVSGESAIVATPLHWNEVKEGLRSEDFNHETILKRLRQVGDPFESLSKKKQNPEALLKRLHENYSFLIS
ncbi:MAG TPA: hypothetical protein VIN08_27215 [Ohtaekwangia sp.]|uniref:non-homologous end-joining DNA ligase LigD n=1 Tax=Ohtaekwangia sp. TaxID=2066019 RepID=UPI002F922953